MRQRKAGRQLRRTSEQRLALLRNLATSLIENGAIETTEAKAKELRPFVEKIISKAKTGTLHSRRLAGRHIQKRAAADKLYAELREKGANVQGEPISQPWGLREFRVLDIEGNQIKFGQPFE